MGNRTIIPDITENPISPEELEREAEIDKKVEHLKKERRDKQKRRRVETSDDEGRQVKRVRIFQEDGSQSEIPTILEKTQTASLEKEACKERCGADAPVNPER